MEDTLTANLGQLSVQPLVLPFHRKVALAYAREAPNNRLHRKL
jgi:hypothetical protein